MQKLHRPGLTLWHTFVVCALVAMATTVTANAGGRADSDEGYSQESRRQHDALLPAEPVVLRKGEFVIYDSKMTAGKLWQVKSEADARAVLKVLDPVRYAKDVAAGRL